MTARHRDFLDRIGHVRDRDGDEALGCDTRIHIRHCPNKTGERSGGIKRLITLGTENRRETIRPNFPEHDIAIGHGQRPAPPIGRRAGIGPGRLRADDKARAIETADRPATRRDRMDAHHRRADADARHSRLIIALIMARIMRDICRGAAHIETDHPIKPCLARGADHADNPARRPRQDRVLALERGAGGQPAARLHEHCAWPVAECGFELVDIAAQDRGEIGIGHGRIAPPDQFDERPDTMADRDLGEADLLRDPGQFRLMRGKPVSVHQDNCDGAIPLIKDPLKLGFARHVIEWAKHFALCRHPLINLDHPAVKRLGQDNLPREKIGPILIADPQGIAEPARDRQHHSFPLAFKQGVGGNRRPHADFAGRQWAIGDAGQFADRRDRCIVIAFGIFGKQLGRQQGAFGCSRDDIGEGAAAINPELPVLQHSRTISSRSGALP